MLQNGTTNLVDLFRIERFLFHDRDASERGRSAVIAQQRIALSVSLKGISGTKPWSPMRTVRKVPQMSIGQTIYYDARAPSSVKRILYMWVDVDTIPI